MFHSKTPMDTWHTAGQHFCDSLIDPYQNIDHLKDSHAMQSQVAKWPTGNHKIPQHESILSRQHRYGLCVCEDCKNKTNKKHHFNRHGANIILHLIVSIENSMGSSSPVIENRLLRNQHMDVGRNHGYPWFLAIWCSLLCKISIRL